MKNRWLSILKSSFNGFDSKCLSDVKFAEFSSSAAERSLMSGFSKRVAHQVGGHPVLLLNQWTRQHSMFSQSARSFASKTTESTEQKTSETRKDISTVEDPFAAPTYNIPEKPVTFTEGASYSLIILAGLGIAAAAAYGALERIQNDSQVRVRIGSPITGYGSESRNRAARQRIPHNTWTDEEGVEHVMVNFYIRGPHGAGKAYAEMFKDKVDKQWKFMYLIVEMTSPSPAQLMLESYVPA
ncbi:putative mitochondrial import inner membrane translocase subunit TIM21 [Forsythia ovata]|uniref:Mitochondrial import inner membrane translocase subunit Tim21 n=1 Tax=Forsythia ovata TaxID=205694 RepID=A0ABD1QP53_9LAMI